MNLEQELKWRGLIFDVTDDEIFEKLENEKIIFYLGADPTADSLHVGHLLTYLVAKRLQDYGHQPILLIGGGTGLIGDPRPNRGERQLLSLEQSLKNADGIISQVKKMLPKATVVNNYDWISKYDVITFLRDIGKHFNINYMINKDTVKSRLDSGISYTEFSYQLIQALDFYHLFKENGCSLQMGGQDQWGNIVSGLDLIRKREGSEAKAYGLTWPLVTKSDGTKFGKSEGGAVWLDPKKTSPYEFYQFWINTTDADAIVRLKQFTFLSFEDTEKILKEMETSPHLRSAQKELAKQMTTLVHSKEAYDQALKISQALFSGNIKSLTADEIELGFKEVPSIDINEDKLLIDVLIEAGLAQSKREAKQFIESNAVSINGDKINTLEFVITKNKAIDKKFTVIRRGKKKYALVMHK